MLKSSYTNSKIEAGCDEAGRGCLAGPVFAASVILPLNFKYNLLNDSKKLNISDRYFLREIILKNAIAWAVASADHQEIDKINILNASFLAMHRAIDKLTQKPELLLIDGNRFKPYKNIDHVCIIKGDGKYASMAAASILAKTYRDDFMIKMAKEYPQYRWEKNKAYPTKEHRNAILKNGITPYHRKSFQLLKPLTLG
ncbi:MAG: ribonuclease HII [Bacteroidetes bacterium]|nr:ribonuclease HII [Bacteroidota bacterium]